LIGLVLLGQVLHAQELQVDTIRTVRPWGRPEVYTFPHVVMPQRPGIAAAINKDLCVDLLEADPDTTLPGQLFSQVWGDTVTGWMPRLNSITWTTSRPFLNVFTVAFEAEGCGAYCEGFSTFRSYDLRSGRRLDFDSLLTPEGAYVVFDSLDHRWRRTVEAQIHFLEDTLRTPGMAPEYVDWGREALELYRSCLEDRPEGQPYVGDIEPLKEGLRCWVARCSVHANRSVDDLDAVPLDLAYSWLGPHLRPEWHGLFTR
jgi:hypothetical protein